MLRPGKFVRRPSPVARRPSPVVVRPSSFVRRRSPVVVRPSSFVRRPAGGSVSARWHLVIPNGVRDQVVLATDRGHAAQIPRQLGMTIRVSWQNTGEAEGDGEAAG
jgi:hypothetical protein